jgi:hypothetical protein
MIQPGNVVSKLSSPTQTMEADTVLSSQLILTA